MEYCGNCNTKLGFTNTPNFGGGKFSNNYRLCLNCFGKLLKLDKSANTKKFTVDQVKEKLNKTNEIINRIENQKVSENKTVELNFDAIPIENLLSEIQNITKIDEIEIWDKKAIYYTGKIVEFLEKLKYAKSQIDEEIKVSTGFNPIKNFFAKSKIASRHNGFLKQYENVYRTLENYNNLLEYWINISPNSLQELNEMKSELKEKQQLFAIRKKELNLFKKQAWSNYRQNSAYVEFSSPKLRHFYRGLNIREREKNLNPFDEELNNITLQLIEIDKLILWLNKIK